MAGPARRVIVCGFDGATYSVLDPLMRAGAMPHLAAAMPGGNVGACASTIPPITAPAWTTCVTGVNPGKHGVFTFFSRDPATRAPQFVSSAAIRMPTLWQRLSRAGRTVGVANVPITYPPEPVNGYMITGFLTPKDRPYTFPADLQVELDAAGYRIAAPPPRETDIPEDMARRWLSELYEVTQRRTEAALKLQERYDPEFAMVVYMSPDHIQHPFYKLLDPGQPHYASPLADALRGTLNRCFTALDDAFEAYRSSLGPDDLLLVCSDHGFGPHDGTLFLNRWLMRNGYLRVKRSAMVRQEAARIARARLGRRFPAFRRGARAAGPEAFEDAYIDHDASVAIGGGNAEFAVYALSPDAPLDDIAAGLKAISHPIDGTPVVEDVLTREQCYSGPWVSEAPELLIRLAADRYSIRSRIVARRPGVFVANEGPDGEHVRTGILMAFGGPVAAGRALDARLEDIAPTVLYALGEKIPSTVDGRVLTEAFRTDVTATHAPQIADEDLAPAAQAETPYSEEDAEQIAARLANLGYID